VQKNYVRSVRALAEAVELGLDGPPDLERAFALTEQGANLGDGQCQYQHAKLILKLREKPDLKLVLDLLISAVEDGVNDAAQLLHALEERARFAATHQPLRDMDVEIVEERPWDVVNDAEIAVLAQILESRDVPGFSPPT
jgi:hypothetical protein